MKILFFLIILLNSFLLFGEFRNNNAVISEYAGRMGDCLVAFAHTLYFSMKNNCEMFLVPFPYSDQLVLDDVIKKYSHEIQYRYHNKVTFQGGDVFIDQNIKNTLFKIPHFPEGLPEYYIRNFNKHFFIEWDNYSFKKELRRLIYPKNKLSLIIPPKDKISVAVHVRKGGGYDVFDYEEWKTEEFIHRFYKLPLQEYYINQLRNLSKLLNHRPLYVFVFTDDQNPEALVELYKKELNIPTIEFDYRKSGNRHDANVLEDLFSMLNFDVLIRTNSSYSIIAEKIGDFKIVIFPVAPLPGSYVNEGLICVNKLLN